MSNKGKNDSEDYLSPKDMREWMDNEIAAAAKAHELRVKDVTSFVSAYGAGEITPQQAEDMQLRYTLRWGEPLPVPLKANESDEQLLARIDQAYSVPSKVAAVQKARAAQENPSTDRGRQ